MVAVVLCMVAVGLEGASEASSSVDALLPQTFIGWQLSGIREWVIAKNSLLLKIGFLLSFLNIPPFKEETGQVAKQKSLFV